MALNPPGVPGSLFDPSSNNGLGGMSTGIGYGTNVFYGPPAPIGMDNGEGVLIQNIGETGTIPAQAAGYAGKPVAMITATSDVAVGGFMPDGSTNVTGKVVPAGAAVLGVMVTPPLPPMATLKWGATKTSHITYSENDTLARFTNTSGSGGCLGAVSMAPNSGKYYWEVSSTGGATQFSAETPFAGFGWVGIPDLTASSINDVWGLYADGTACNDGSGVGTSYSGGVSTSPRRLMFAYDSGTRQWWAGTNGTWFSGGNPAAGTGAGPGLVNAGMTVTPVFRESFGWNATSMLHGRGACYYPPPAGFEYLGETPMDADAADWRIRAIAAGGSVKDSTQVAVNKFVIAAKGLQYWAKFNRVNLMCGDQLAAMLVPLKVGNGAALDTNVGYIAADYTEATGLKGDGTAKYLNTGLLPTALTINNTHLSYYDRSADFVWPFWMGASDSPGPANWLQLGTHTDSKARSDQYNNADGNGRLTSPVITTPIGLMIGSRQTSSDHRIFNKSSQVANNSAVGGALPGYPITVGVVNQSNNFSGFSNHTIAGYTIGSSLTANDASGYNVDMHLFQTALGRAVPWG